MGIKPRTPGLCSHCFTTKAMTTGQPPALTILYVYCTGGNESRTPGSILVCAISSDCRPFYTTDGTFLRKSLVALFVLTSRGCNRSVVPAGTMITTISFSNFSSSKVVVWPPKLSVRTKAFWDDAPISSLTFSIYQRSEDRFLH